MKISVKIFHELTIKVLSKTFHQKLFTWIAFFFIFLALIEFSIQIDIS